MIEVQNKAAEVIVEEKEKETFFQTVPVRNEQESEENILKRIEENLDILSEKVTSADDTRAMYDSMVDFYNSFALTSKELTEKLNKEVDYTRFLESEIEKKKYHLDYLSLKKNLSEDRAQVSVLLDKIKETVDLRLKEIDDREKTEFDLLEGKIQLMDKKIEDFSQINKLMEENLKAFRKDMTKAAENEYKILQNKCREVISDNTNSIEKIKETVIEFLKVCKTHNEELINNVPVQKRKFDPKDLIVYLVSAVCIVSMIAQIFV